MRQARQICRIRDPYSNSSSSPGLPSSRGGSAPAGVRKGFRYAVTRLLMNIGEPCEHQCAKCPGVYMSSPAEGDDGVGCP
uniref:Uncharacterized protein n=1 Tax=Paenarthrobacter aurescens TaxID=43663 RepID=Q6SK27_PAEAU|nr:hypothetical protein [Paenarthrobacter aurescens]